MPFFTSATRRREQVWLQAGSRVVSFASGPTITLPEATQQGQEIVAADVGADVWVVVTGVANDRGYLLKRNDRSWMMLGTDKVHGRYPSWVLENGDVSWVQKDNPYLLHHLVGSPTEDTRDTANPHSPDQSGAIEDWAGLKVCNVYRHGDWASGTYAYDASGMQTVLLRNGSGTVLKAGTFRTQIPPHCVSFDDGTAMVCVQVPDGIETPTLIYSMACVPFVPPQQAVTVPEFVKNKNRCAVIVDGKPSDPWFIAHNYQVSENGLTLGVLHSLPHDNAQLRVHEGMALQLKTPFYSYWDGGNPEDVRFDVPFVPWLPMIQCYPGKGEHAEAFASRVRALFAKADGTTRAFGVYACGFLGLGTSGERTEQQVVDAMAIVADVACLYPRCRIVVVYTWDRDGLDNDNVEDGVAFFPSTQQAVSRWRASVANPDDVPTVAELSESHPSQPPVITPPKPPITEPPVQPTKPSRRRFLLMNIDAPRPAMELNKSHFRNGGYDNRKLYEWKDANNKRLGNLGVDIDGKYTVNENTGPGESWIYEEGSGEASIESVNCCYTLTVREDR